MELVGQAVPHRDAGELGEGLDGLLREAAVLDAVERPPEDPGGVLHGLLVPDLRAGRLQVRDVRALVVRRHLERRAGPGRGLLEDERDVLPGQPLDLVAAVLRGLEVRREPQQELQLGRREVELLHEAPVPQVESHSPFPPQAAAGTGSGTDSSTACGAARPSRRRTKNLIISSTASSVREIPMQIHHWANVRETVPLIRWRNPIAVTAMMASSANP